ncbi:MAG: peptide transporter ATP-binding protein, partial [Glaciihabitans sp.]|nr:peptide transporter ATP-binding protein [Glaciihabitans sp.]
ADGTTIVMATHEMAFARDVAHRVVFLDGGVIAESGPPSEMFGSPREERTREFLARFSDR